VFVRPAAGQPAEIRTIGWDDDGPSEDGNLAATFTLDTDRPLTLRGWSWTGGAEGRSRPRGPSAPRRPDGARGVHWSGSTGRLTARRRCRRQNPLVAAPEEGCSTSPTRTGRRSLDTLLRVGDSAVPTLESSRRTFEDGDGAGDGFRHRRRRAAGRQLRGRLAAGDPRGARSRAARAGRSRDGDVRVAGIAGEVVSADVIR
jgi:hypothetical protein